MKDILRFVILIYLRRILVADSSEILRLRAKDFDINQKQIRLDKKTVYVDHHALWVLLEDLLKHYQESPNEYVFLKTAT